MRKTAIRRSDRRDTRGSTEMPDHFKLRQSVGSDARRWYRRETGATPVGGSYCPVAQQRERPALTREVDGANPSGAATFLEAKADSRAERDRLHEVQPEGWRGHAPSTVPPPVEAGRSCNRSLWSMTTDFRFWVASIAAMQRSLKPRSTGQHRGDSPISIWKLNRTSAPGLFRKQIVPHRGMGSMTSGFRHFHAGLAEQPCTRLVNEIRPGQHR